MTDFPATISGSAGDNNRPLEVRWYRDPEGRVMQTQASSGSPIDLPAEWTLLPADQGERMFHEQQQHAEEAMARAVAAAADEAARMETERGEHLDQFATMMAITVEQAARLLGVPLPGQRPMNDPHAAAMHVSGPPGLAAAHDDNVGL